MVLAVEHLDHELLGAVCGPQAPRTAFHHGGELFRQLPNLVGVPRQRRRGGIPPLGVEEGVCRPLRVRRDLDSIVSRICIATSVHLHPGTGA